MRLRVSLPGQTLEVLDADGRVARTYPVSTAANGAGEERNSFCTPRGRHIVRAKIAERDWILTRILWLSGKEPGYNRLGNCDSMRRYIYIHGTPDETFAQTPSSHGCIRMRNEDLAELFEQVPVYTPVEVVA